MAMCIVEAFRPLQMAEWFMLDRERLAVDDKRSTVNGIRSEIVHAVRTADDGFVVWRIGGCALGASDTVALETARKEQRRCVYVDSILVRSSA